MHIYTYVVSISCILEMVPERDHLKQAESAHLWGFLGHTLAGLVAIESN